MLKTEGTHSNGNYPLFEVLPSLEARVRRVPLGSYPTPVSAVSAADLGIPFSGSELFIKREDLSAANYGGNKVRPLELLFGDALDRGAQTMWATGSLGSNHAVATAIHAKAAGLKAGALLWPQPTSLTARDNLRALLATGADIRCLRSLLLYPLAAARLGRDLSNYVQTPGGAVPLGALGHLSAALELAMQIEAGELPAPTDIVVPVGSTCTAAGLLVGVRLARHFGLGFQDSLPTITAVRVTPWPVTDRRAIVWLARRTQALLATLGGPTLAPIPMRADASFVVNRRYLGPGYAVPTSQGRDAIARFSRTHALQLDTTYSAKAAALALDMLTPGSAANTSRRIKGPVLLWATKSSAPLTLTDVDASLLPPSVRRWLDS